MNNRPVLLPPGGYCAKEGERERERETVAKFESFSFFSSPSPHLRKSMSQLGPYSTSSALSTTHYNLVQSLESSRSATVRFKDDFRINSFRSDSGML